MENKDVLLSNDVEKMETFNVTLNDYSYDLSKLSLWPNLLKITLECPKHQITASLHSVLLSSKSNFIILGIPL
jgi:hypothetical protein